MFMYILIYTLEFQIEGEGGINGRLANFAQNNKRRGCNKRGGWQKSPELVNGEVGVNKDAGKNNN